MGVAQLGYIGLNVSDADNWRDVLSNILGLEIRQESPLSTEENAPFYARMDDRHHRLALSPGKQDGIRYAGWEASSWSEFEQLSDCLSKGGIKTIEGSAQDCLQRKVQALFRFQDPEGNAAEIFVCPEVDHVPFAPGRPTGGFKTGSLGMGHVVYHCAHYRETVDFYQQWLGFKVSDYIVWADADATFMRCNPRHHSLALLNESLGFKGGDANHIMLEANSLIDVGIAYDMVRARGLPIIMELGCHSNDRVTSFYFVSPSGIGIELGWGGQLVDDDSWTIRKFNSTKIWGHQMNLPPDNAGA